MAGEDYQTNTDLELPFNGIWNVTNGGRDSSTNNHIRPDGNGPASQLFAYDFTRAHKGEGKDLEDYEAFGEEVLAPGGGVVCQIIDGSVDILPGERDRNVGVGNAVFIDHGNGEWSVLCHFKHNSIKVKVGDEVIQGDVLGLCGNTGNTSEPHIHFHLQNGPLMHKAVGLPALFKKIKLDGSVEEMVEPIRGQRVANFN